MATAPMPSPTLYQRQGSHLHVTYATTGVDGKPHVTYQDASRTLSFVGDEVRTLSSEIGDLVSVSIHRTVDTGSTSFTLLVPHVNLGQATSAPIKTERITTIHRFSVVSARNQGQTELYSVVALTGTASPVAL